MNSPSSSETMLQPIRMCRLSDSDLYCVAMKIRRRPELRQLLRAKSMIRYGPPKYTAGLARSFVSGYRRSPAPPASTIASVSSTCAGMGDSALAEEHARRRAVGPDDAEREAQHLVNPGIDVAQVQALDHDRAAAEQDAVRRGARFLVLLDRQVVHADHLDAMIDQVPGGALRDADVVGAELGRSPQTRVGGLDEEPHVLREVEVLEIRRLDAAARCDLDDARPPEQHLERQRLGAEALIEEVPRRIDVRAGVGAHVDGRDVRALAARDPLDRLQAEGGIARVGGQTGVERHRDVDQLHQALYRAPAGLGGAPRKAAGRSRRTALPATTAGAGGRRQARADRNRPEPWMIARWFVAERTSRTRFDLARPRAYDGPFARTAPSTPGWESGCMVNRQKFTLSIALALAVS